MNRWGYVRQSQESEASIDQQMASIREFCNKHDLSLATTRNDGRNTSGFSIHSRPEYSLLREKIRDGEIDGVVTRDRARLSRDFDERLRLIQWFREHEIEWHVVEAGGRLGLEDTQNAMFECLHAGMDDLKKRAEIERAKQVVRERQEKGYYQGQPPFGFRFDDDGQYLEPDPGEMETALRIIEMDADGMSQRAIAAAVEPSRGVVRSVLEDAQMYLEEADR